MKGLIRFFLSLSLLLLSGYNSMYANLSPDFTRPTSTDILEKSADAAISAMLNSNAQAIEDALPGTTKEYDRIYATEDEDEDDNDKLSLLKKHPAVKNYFTTFFYTQASGKFCHLKKRLPFYGQFSYFASSKYILICVIRI